MLCYRFSDPGSLNIVERLVFKYEDCYYAFDSLLLDSNLSNHKRVSHFRLERWLKRRIELVIYEKYHKFPDTLEQYLEDISVENLRILCKYHHSNRIWDSRFIIGDITKFKDVILD